MQRPVVTLVLDNHVAKLVGDSEIIPDLQGVES